MKDTAGQAQGLKDLAHWCSSLPSPTSPHRILLASYAQSLMKVQASQSMIFQKVGIARVPSGGSNSAEGFEQSRCLAAAFWRRLTVFKDRGSWNKMEGDILKGDRGRSLNC